VNPIPRHDTWDEGIGFGLHGPGTGWRYRPQRRRRPRIDWFVVALCLFTLAWCAFRAYQVHRERMAQQASEVAP